MTNTSLCAFYRFSRMLVVALLLTVGFSFSNASIVLAQDAGDTVIVNCSNCNPDSTTEAQEVADVLNLTSGTVFVIHNFNQGVTVSWSVGSTGNVTAVSGDFNSPQAPLSQPAGTLTNSGTISISSGTTNWSSYSDPTCYSAFPCTSTGFGEL